MRIPNIKQLNDQFLNFYKKEHGAKPTMVPAVQQKQEFAPIIDEQRVHSHGSMAPVDYTEEDTAYAPNPSSFMQVQMRRQSNSFNNHSEAEVRRNQIAQAIFKHQTQQNFNGYQGIS